MGTFDPALEQLKTIIGESGNIVFFGGAGTSTESAIPDFRSETGLYRTKTNHAYPPEVMLSHSFFLDHPEDFFEFYKTKMIYKDAMPNRAHIALAELERRGKLKTVITQNIDGLHQSAGSQNVLELHGSVLRNTCMGCGTKYSLEDVVGSTEIVPYCLKCGAIIKPDVVLYEEGLDMDVWNEALQYISQADVLLVGGTSLTVNPAASLVRYYNGGKLLLINKSATPYDRHAQLVLNESIGKALGYAVLGETVE